MSALMRRDEREGASQQVTAMFEVKSKTHINRYFADKLHWTDAFRVVQYLSYRGDSSKIPWYYVVTRASSCYTDLTKSMDEILASMKSNTRNEIRRAVKEGCVFSIVEDVDEFIPFYNSFCESKGLNDFTSRAQIGKYKKVLITKATDAAGNVLAMHANILDDASKVALLMFSCSPRLDANVDKKLIGWGNRFLHFKDLEYLKDNGFTYYDWSGVCLDPNSPCHSIGQFKLSFGGQIVDSIVLRTPLFFLLEYVRDALCRFRK